MKISTLKAMLFMAAMFMAMTGNAQETGQKIQLTPEQGALLNDRMHGSFKAKTVHDSLYCGTDTILYPYLKEMAFSAPNDSFFVDAMVGNIRTASQAYHLTGNVNVAGIQFYGGAYSTSVSPQTLLVRAYLYTADASNMPVAKFDSVDIMITEQYRYYTGLFAAPVNISSNFTVAVKCVLNDTLAVITNNAGQSYQSPFYGEGLAWRRFGSGTWNSSLSFFGQDLEYMIFPIVTYGVNTSFDESATVICKDSGIVYTNTSSALFHDRMFNLRAFDEYFYGTISDSTFRWNYGTGGGWSAGLNGQHTYNSAGTFTTTMTSEMMGYFTSCKDTISLDVTVNPSFMIDTTVHICMGDLFQFGTQSLSSEGSYNESFASMAGCDSSVHLILNVDTVDTGVALTGVSLTASAMGAVYQWLYCDSAYMPIPGENNQIFVATTNGNYAVIVTQGSCTDTSSCIGVFSVGMEGSGSEGSSISVYPNPAKQDVTVRFAGRIPEQIMITNTLGQVIRSFRPESALVDIHREELPNAVYFLSFTFENTREVIKLILE